MLLENIIFDLKFMPHLTRFIAVRLRSPSKTRVIQGVDLLITQVNIQRNFIQTRIVYCLVSIDINGRLVFTLGCWVNFLPFFWTLKEWHDISHICYKDRLNS